MGRSIALLSMLVLVIACQSGQKKQVEEGGARLDVPYVIAPKLPDATPKLILYLHGYGANPSEIRQLSQFLHANAWVYGVQAPKKISHQAYSWFDLEFEGGFVSGINREQVDESLLLLRQLIIKVQNEKKIEAEDTYLIGFSQGAFLTCEMMQKYPALLGGGAAICGWLDQAQNNDNPDDCPGPLLLLNANFDERITREQRNEMLKHLRSCSSVESNSFNCTHTITTEMLSEVNKWMLPDEFKP